VLAARRAGKDRFFSAVGVWRAALCCNWREHISAGEGAACLLVGADRQQGRILRKYCQGLLAVPLLAAEVVRSTEDLIEFRNGATLKIVTNDPDLIRGRSAIGVLGSEVCHWPIGEHRANSDFEVISAAKHSMMMCPDGGLLALWSSVGTKEGYMYEAYKELHGNADALDLCWLAPSRTMNPKLSQAYIDDELAADPARALAELMSVWRESADDLIELAVLEEITDKGIYSRPVMPNCVYFAYFDAATGGGKDSAALCIAHRIRDERGQWITVIDQVLERKPRFVLVDVIREWSELLRAYRISKVYSDGYAFQICADEWQRNKIENVKSDRTTAQNYLRALPVLMGRRVRLVDNEVARKQFAGLRRIVTAGHESVDHAAHQHDDVSAAIAGAIATLDSVAAPMVFSNELVAAIDGRHAGGNPYGLRQPGAERNAAMAMRSGMGGGVEWNDLGFGRWR
jgi:hypothetical protein